ncbi:hypothetical protein BC832DRAFT_542022 [Gaertneriomyces semiglobifer]|nr:hypothetical protein BC832DRAFT_542022 [Gaertneriomyces semiglobifer]
MNLLRKWIQATCNTHFAEEADETVIFPQQRIQVRNILAYNPDGDVVIEMEVCDASHFAEACIGKECAQDYESKRKSLFSPFPPITALRGSILILHAAILQLSSRGTPVFNIQKFTFVGCQGMQPIDGTQWIGRYTRRCKGEFNPSVEPTFLGYMDLGLSQLE